MPTFKSGDHVRIVTREQTSQDVKENTYFPHLAGLTGVVSKVYSPEEVCVTIDRDSLPEKNAERHGEIEAALQARWLDTISQDARSKLTEPEIAFNLHYTVLMASKDLEPMKPGRATKPKETPEPVVHQKDLDRAEEEFLKTRKAE